MHRTLSLVILVFAFGLVHGKPTQPDKKKDAKAAGAFKPIEVNDKLDKQDVNDPKIGNPAKQFTVKLHKDKTYIIDLASKDFDPYLRLLDKGGNQLAEDDDSGGDLNARIVHAIDKDADYTIVVTSFDGDVGAFNLKVREFALKGEAKPREVAKEGFSVTDQINQNNMSDLGKLGRLYTFNFKAGVNYTIDLESGDLDSFLYLFDGSSKLIAQDDDSGGDLNSRISFRPGRDGVYHILATSLDGDETGEFTLKVRADK